jgi:hypothetical protein
MKLPYKKTAALFALALFLALAAVAPRAPASDGQDRAQEHGAAVDHTASRYTLEAATTAETRWVREAVGHTPLDVRLDGQPQPVKALAGHPRVIDRPKII